MELKQEAIVSKICPMSKKYHKNEQIMRLITHIFTKLLQNVCLINTHIFMY